MNYRTFFASLIAMVFTIACGKIPGNNGPEEIPVSSVSLDKSAWKMTVGETIQLVASITPSDATNKSITWTSSDQSIATVSNSGLVTAKSPGSTVITADVNGKTNASCVIEVKSKEMIITGDYSDLTATSVILYGWRDRYYDGYANIQVSKSSGFESNSLIKTFMKGYQSDGQTFSIGVQEVLEPSTMYYYRACCVSNDYYGETKSFTTQSLDAEVITRDATDVSYVTATISASVLVTNAPGADVTLDFVYGTSEDLATSGKTIHYFAWPAVDGKYNSCELSDLENNTTYYYQAYITVEGKTIRDKQIKQFKTKDGPKGPNDSVDMGFKSDDGKQLFWATCNLGASKPEECGDLYAWGEIEPKNEFTESNYRFARYGYFTKYQDKDNKLGLDPEDDAAHVKLGGNWRMPSENEVGGLLTYCKWKLTERNGIECFDFKSEENGNHLYFPVENGSIWTCSLGTGRGWTTDYRYGTALFLYHSDRFGYVVKSGNSSRYNGNHVRPVTE